MHSLNPIIELNKISFFHDILSKDEKHSKNNNLLEVLRQVIAGKVLAPDDWAIVQESLEANHPCVLYFKANRNILSRQYMSNNKICTSVPIISFSYKGERYILLMKNIGLGSSINVNEVQWTAHGVRVDKNEAAQDSKDNENVYKKLTNGNVDLSYFIAAAIRRIRELGISISTKDILNIHPIDRDSAGFIEKDPNYRTEYFDVDLGERNPDEIVKSLKSSTSRYSDWTRCFKLSQLKANIRENNNAKNSKVEYSLTYDNEQLPVRETTLFFIKALQIVKENEVKPDCLTKDPWQLINVSPLETAIRWVMLRSDFSVQFTLFSKENNLLSSGQIHAYAAKAGMNEENLAYLSLKPERLLLHVIIANLTTKTKIKDSCELELRVKELYDKYFETYKTISDTWVSEFNKIKIALESIVKNNFLVTNSDNKLSADETSDINRIKELLAKIKTTEISERHRSIYHLSESDIEIAIQIRLYEKFHIVMLSTLRTQIDKIMATDPEFKYQPLEKYPLVNRMCFGVTGPVASGKSVSEKMIRAQLGTRTAAYIGSDEWNILLGKYLQLDKNGYGMHGGNLTLPEAWHIKVLIWEIISEMEKNGEAPNWILETCNPCAVKGPLLGKTTVFINTAAPDKSVDRVKARGDTSGRYVPASVAAGSYRWPWINFVSLLNSSKTSTVIKIVDTDIMYANLKLNENTRMKSANIATYENETLVIHNLHHFLFFIARSFRVNPSPKNLHELWLAKPENSLTLVLNELDKLNVQIKDNYGNLLTKAMLKQQVTHLYEKGIRPLTKSVTRFFANHKRGKHAVDIKTHSAPCISR